MSESTTAAGLAVPAHALTKSLPTALVDEFAGIDICGDIESLADDAPGSADFLPEPKGYKILVQLPEIAETTESGLIKVGSAIQEETVSQIVGYVLRMGDGCYADQKRFPGGAYCEVGDFVVFRAFTGTRLMIRGKEFRLINDDSVEAVVQDPRGIRRVV